MSAMRVRNAHCNGRSRHKTKVPSARMELGTRSGNRDNHEDNLVDRNYISNCNTDPVAMSPVHQRVGREIAKKAIFGFLAIINLSLWNPAIWERSVPENDTHGVARKNSDLESRFGPGLIDGCDFVSIFSSGFIDGLGQVLADGLKQPEELVEIERTETGFNMRSENSTDHLKAP
ncbi:MAG: hypothetical protein FWG02_10560 [Holophagaceae bacterium]|nr:hypothetical protein [Holophagaceae bacterium]